MRGAPWTVVSGPVNVGIIPADAGSTRRLYRRPFAEKDHPRGCGEHITAIISGGFTAGSSPRMRGALDTVPLSHRFPRIIPADAGSTYDGLDVDFPHEDHPRGCGEHALLSR